MKNITSTIFFIPEDSFPFHLAISKIAIELDSGSNKVCIPSQSKLNIHNSDRNEFFDFLEQKNQGIQQFEKIKLEEVGKLPETKTRLVSIFSNKAKKKLGFQQIIMVNLIWKKWNSFKWPFLEIQKRIYGTTKIQYFPLVLQDGDRLKDLTYIGLEMVIENPDRVFSDFDLFTNKSMKSFQNNILRKPKYNRIFEW
jgi:hypothetical protein